MKVFITGGTGYIGGRVADTLRAHGHQVTGLARSAEAAEHLLRRGMTPVRGGLEDAEVLMAAAQAADAVIQTAFVIERDISASIRAEGKALAALLAAVEGTGKPLISTSGTAVLGDTGTSIFNERTPITPHPLSQRLDNEDLILRAPGVHASSSGRRMSMVMGTGTRHSPASGGQDDSSRPFPMPADRAITCGQPSKSTIWPNSTPSP